VEGVIQIDIGSAHVIGDGWLKGGLLNGETYG